MLEIVLLAGKFIFLIVLYLFIYKVVRSTTRELRAAAPVAAPPQWQASGGVAAPPGPAASAPETAMWTLRVLKSPTVPVGAAYALKLGAHAMAGRSPEMDIFLDDTFVSSKHALFEVTAAGLQLEDLRSTNGTQVNGSDTEGAVLLRPGDRVEVGDTVFHVEAE
jgi:biotin carboxyl carrier protein